MTLPPEYQAAQEVRQAFSRIFFGTSLDKADREITDEEAKFASLKHLRARKSSSGLDYLYVCIYLCDGLEAMRKSLPHIFSEEHLFRLAAKRT